MRWRFAVLYMMCACDGSFETPSASVGEKQLPARPPQEALAGPPTRGTVARRLTREELARTVHRLLGNDAPIDTSLLPDDTLTPFDNDVLEQSPSMRLVESMETIALDLASWTTATPARMSRVVPCVTEDAACFRSFVTTFGLRALRRPLSDEEANGMAELFSYGFKDGVAVALRVFFLHPELLYRVEPGVSTDGGLVRLSSYELATRLSFLLQGTTPDDALLTAAASGALDRAETLRQEAERLISSPEGKEQIRRFHAFWLGYSTLTQLPIQQKLREETDALVDRATEAGRDYDYLLLANETLLDDALAAHYSLPAPGARTWVSYGDAPRRGILSHGMFAAAGAKFGDTSPTRRGKFIRERFLCQTIQLPTVNVDVDLPPQAKSPNACKVERYSQHRTDAVCAGCHALMDPIGFGLENFDELGVYRTHDKDRPECVIDGKGQLDEQTPFTGAKELADILVASPRLQPCLGEHFIHFAAGRKLDGSDLLRARWLGSEMKDHGNSFAALMLAYVTHENFRYREE